MCIPVWISTRVDFSWSIAGVVVAGIKTGFVLLSHVPKSVAIMVVWLS